MMVRRRFISREAAETFPMDHSLWARLWVEEYEVAPAAPKVERLTPKEHLDRCFDEILQAAKKGQRCPENESGHVNSTRCGKLARDGLIKVEVFARNYRVVTILVGKDAGLKTAPPPYRVTQPKFIIDKQGGRALKRFMQNDVG